MGEERQRARGGLGSPDPSRGNSAANYVSDRLQRPIAAPNLGTIRARGAAESFVMLAHRVGSDGARVVSSMELN